MSDIITNAVVAARGDNPARQEIRAPTNAAFTITDTKVYVPVVTLSTEDDNKFLEQLKTGFKRTIKWNKYRSQMTNQAKTNNFIISLIQHLIKSIPYLCSHLKMKTVDLLFQSITHQKLKKKSSMY